VRLVAVAVALAVLAGTTGCGGEDRAGAPDETAPAPAETSGPSDRPAAPRIEGISLEGQPVSLADYAGTPVLVNVWSSW
jgi:hypothetical protein